MKTIALWRLPWLVAFWGGWMLASFSCAAVPLQVNLEVSNIRHTFESGTIRDWLISTSTDPNNPALPTITADLGPVDTLVVRFSAPAGKKFLIHAQPQTPVVFSGRLVWRAGTNDWLWSPQFGTVSAAFEDFHGVPPSFADASAFHLLSPSYDESFGFYSLQSRPITTDITFTSLTFTGRVDRFEAGRGVRNYLPRPDCYFHIAGDSPEDSGPRLLLIPADQPLDVVVPLSEALDTEGTPFVWTLIGGDSMVWHGYTAVSHDGTDAAQSGTVTAGSAVTLQGKAVGPGTLTWWWKVSSETNRDYFKVFVDGVQQARISGETDWQQHSLELAPGLHVLKWTYAKDASGTGGMDKGWIDQVQFAPDSRCAFSLVPTTRQHGTLAQTALVEVMTGLDCPWSVLCTNDWVVIDPPVVRRGPGTVKYTVFQTLTNQPRTAVLEIAGQPFAITQAANASIEHPPGLTESLDIQTNWHEVIYDYYWFGGQRSVTHDGTDAVQLGPGPHQSATSVHVGAWGPGTLSFWWKVSSETNLDMLKFFGPAGEVRLSGEVDWQFRTYTLTSGWHQFFWTYAKDESFSVGNDRGWLDQVQFVPSSTASVRLAPTSRVHGFGAESNNIQVSVTTPGIWRPWCTADWIFLRAEPVNSNDASFGYILSTNITGMMRTGHIYVADQTVTLVQDHGTCHLTFSITNAVHGWQSGIGSFTATTTAGCPNWLSTTNSWISYSGLVPDSSAVQYGFERNDGFLPRQGTLRAFQGDQLTITQEGNPNAMPPFPRILGTNQVTSIGHTFTPPGILEGGRGQATDFLVDQGQTSGGGAVLPHVFVDMDPIRRFAWKFEAPPGMKFVVRPPPGARVYFHGTLWWVAAGDGNGWGENIGVQFEGLAGDAPSHISGSARLSDTHGFFSIYVVTTGTFSNSLSFTSVTLEGLVRRQVTGLGTLEFTPRLDSALQFEYMTDQLSDPGRFVTLEPLDPGLNLRVLGYGPTTGIGLRLQGPRFATHIVEASSDLRNWTPISTNVMPDIDCPICPYVDLHDRTVPSASQRFYRARQQ